MTKCCEICGKKLEQVFTYEDRKKIRVGWLCLDCWPAPGSWVKAILRERVVNAVR